MNFMFPGTYQPMPIGGLWGYCTAGKIEIVELESVSTVVNIRGFVAQVNAKLLYHNSSSSPLQVRYTLPVDESAAVYKFEAHLDGRKILAHCMEKKKAEKVYKEAVDAGKTAILTRQDERSSDMLQLDLGNLPEGSKATLSISLVMELKVQTDGGVSFVLPTVLNPRYSPAGGPTAPRGFNTELEQEKVVTVTKAYTIDIKARVSGGHEIARIISHTDSLNVTIGEDLKSAEVTQDGGFKSDHDWSLLLYYANPYKTRVIRETGDRSATGLMKDDLVMINLFPEVPANSYSSKNEVIFLIDRSGSMQGDKIQSARATLLLFLKSLPMGCLFNVISFGSDFKALFPKSCEYNENTLKKACKLQEKMDADMGGTEIFGPFQHVYSTAPTPGYARQILLISDGEVYNVDEVTQMVGRHAHETRVFAVGIGYGASTALIRGVARAGGGRSEMVVQQDRLQLKVMGLVSSMVQDNVQNVRVACEMEPTSSVKLVPKVPPIIFGGQHLTLYARVPSTSIVKTLSIMGNIGDADLSIGIKDSDIVSVHDSEMSLHRLAARAQINQWQLDEEDDVAEDMIALSIASGVVSELTALVGVDQDGKTVAQKCQESPETSPEISPEMLMSQRVGAAPPAFVPQNFAMPMWGVSASSGAVRFKKSPPLGGMSPAPLTPMQPTRLSQYVAFGSSASSVGCTAGGSLFGAQAPAAGGSLFGAQAPTAGGSLFGAQAPTTATAGGGGFRFGSNASEQCPTPLSQSVAFGSAASSFGCTTDTSLFGAQVPTTGGSLFGAQAPAPGGSLFGAQAPTTGGSLFGSQAPTTGGSLFGSQVPTTGGSLSGAQAPTTATAGGGGFRFGSNASEQCSAKTQVRGASRKARNQSDGGGFDVDCVMTEQSDDGGFDVDCVMTEQSDDGGSDDELLKIVSLQNFDGSWTLEDISKHCAKSCAQLKESNPSQNKNAWATAVALALLESQFGDARAEWSLLANKARLFISNCGEDVDDLVKKAQSFLATPQ
nr:von Willebrand factor A domain-containing protein 5A-like isoform X2 [Procambarus clarkii]